MLLCPEIFIKFKPFVLNFPTSLNSHSILNTDWTTASIDSSSTTNVERDLVSSDSIQATSLPFAFFPPDDVKMWRPFSNGVFGMTRTTGAWLRKNSLFIHSWFQQEVRQLMCRFGHQILLLVLLRVLGASFYSWFVNSQAKFNSKHKSLLRP